MKQQILLDHKYVYNYYFNIITKIEGSRLINKSTSSVKVFLFTDLWCRYKILWIILNRIELGYVDFWKSRYIANE